MNGKTDDDDDFVYIFKKAFEKCIEGFGYLELTRMTHV